MHLVHTKGCLGQYETTFDTEMETIADIMELGYQNQILGDLMINPDVEVTIAEVIHTSTGPGQDNVKWVVKVVQNRVKQVWNRALNGSSGIHRLRGINLVIISLGKLWLRKKLDKPQSTALKKESSNITLLPRIAKLNTDNTPSTH
jgi:hypothetical protein